MVREHRGAIEHLLEDDQQLLERDVRQLGDDGALDGVDAGLKHVALHSLERVDVPGRLLEPLVLLQAAHELRARIFLVLLVRRPSEATASAT